MFDRRGDVLLAMGAVAGLFASVQVIGGLLDSRIPWVSLVFLLVCLLLVGGVLVHRARERRKRSEQADE